METTRRSFLKAVGAAVVTVPAAAVSAEPVPAPETPIDPRLVYPPEAPEGFIWVREVDLVQCGDARLKIHDHHGASRHVLLDFDAVARHIYLRTRLSARGHMHSGDFVYSWDEDWEKADTALSGRKPHNRS